VEKDWIVDLDAGGSPAPPSTGRKAGTRPPDD
jgi:hypothetical protein